MLHWGSSTPESAAMESHKRLGLSSSFGRHRHGGRCAIVLAGLLVTIAVGATSCDDSGKPVAPYSPPTLGAIEGYVRTLGKGVSVDVRVDATDGDRTSVQTRSDRTGWY